MPADPVTLARKLSHAYGYGGAMRRTLDRLNRSMAWADLGNEYGAPDTAHRMERALFWDAVRCALHATRHTLH